MMSAQMLAAAENTEAALVVPDSMKMLDSESVQAHQTVSCIAL